MAEITPDLQAASLTGRVIVRFDEGSKPAGALILDAGVLTVDDVHEQRVGRAFTKSSSRLHIELPARHRDAPPVREVAIRYHGTPTHGIHFDRDAPQVHTAFSTSQWMPCIDAPDVRAPLTLTLRLPAGLVPAATGSLVDTRDESNGRVATTWQLGAPMPSYLYGFAAGRFTEVIERAGAVELRLLATPSFDAAQVRRVFRETAGMLAFFEHRAGVPYPAPRYTQVLLKGPAAQELSGLSILGERYGRRVLEDETALWLGAHELAHSWWGNGVINHAWTEFWLNEGIASFMTAAYLEHRFGRATYDELMSATRAKVEALRDAGKDHALVYANWDRPSADDRSIVYDKGAYVVHLLRIELGEQAFWRGLQHYTRTHWGRSVTSADFQRAMETSSGRDLGPFFSRWLHTP